MSGTAAAVLRWLWPTTRCATHWCNGRPQSATDVRWQHRDDLHMTLHFLGGRRLRGSTACAHLSALVGTPFTAGLDDIGYWPRRRCCGRAQFAARANLCAAWQLGEGLASKLGFAPEEREYRPHITLARKVRRLNRSLPLSPAGLAVIRTRFGRSWRGASRHGTVRSPAWHAGGRMPVAILAGKQKENELHSACHKHDPRPGLNGRES